MNLNMKYEITESNKIKDRECPTGYKCRKGLSEQGSIFSRNKKTIDKWNIEIKRFYTLKKRIEQMKMEP